MFTTLVCTFCLLPAITAARSAPTGPDSLSCPPSMRYLYWTGEADDDFFNEGNWRFAHQDITAAADGTAPGLSVVEWLAEPAYKIWAGDHPSANSQHPRSGTLDPGQPIRFDLYVRDANLHVAEPVIFSCNERGITLVASEMTVAAGPVNGVYSLDQRSTLKVLGQPESFTGWKVNLLDARSWAYFLQNDPLELRNAGAGNLLIDDRPGTPGSDCRLDQYYQSGTVFRKLDASYTPLTLFEGSAGTGTSGGCAEQTIYRSGSIPAGLDDAVSSFKLERGYQAVVAVNENGTSMSKVFIASEEDLTLDELPIALDDNISFIRVLPWEWITKKGTGGYFPDLNAGWYYNWGLSKESEPNYSYVPMSWGAEGAMSRGLSRLIGNRQTAHVLGFNESDNCNDQSGRWNNLCDPEVAVAYYEQLMGTGLRLGSPAPREEGPFGWLDQFTQIARERDVRFDFVAVHWYDWGSKPAQTPNAPAAQIFERFKKYLENVYAKYELPIWITEFNANPNRENAIQDEFLRLALPYLESLDYVERYAYFQPDPQYASNTVAPARYYDDAGNLTNIGEIYLNHPSTPSIPEPTYAGDNSLTGLDQPYVDPPVNLIAFEAECSPYIGNQVEIVTAGGVSNEMYARLDTNRAGAKELAQQLQFDFTVDAADTYRMWIRYQSGSGAKTGVRFYVDGAEQAQNIGGLLYADWGWEQMPRFLDLEAGKHRVTVQFTNLDLQLDAVAFVSGKSAVDLSALPSGSCTPPASRWGITQTDTTYVLEGEAAGPLGAAWQIGTDTSAFNGAYIGSSTTATDFPPGTDGQAVFTFAVKQNDEYNLWAKVQALAETSDAFWVSVDGGEFFQWQDLKSKVFEWRWAQVQETSGTDGGALAYFLEAGTHTITFAYCEADAKIDRVAISSVGRSPATDDPNVVLPGLVLEFEAEDATLVGINDLKYCAVASNGQYVKPGNASSNRIRFEGIGIRNPGTYLLSVTYMSKNVRRFGVVVNGERLAAQVVEPSGLWCYEGGSTAVHRMLVPMIAGENVIELTGVWADAPFIDKIFLEKVPAVIQLEAEHAALTGGAQVKPCSSASNGEYVNTFEYSGNGIRFDNLIVGESGTYDLKIDYVSKNVRVMDVEVNGGTPQRYTFASSGNWCWEGGVPASLTVTVELTAGSNQILLRNADQQAPLVDKITLAPAASDAVQSRPLELQSAATKVSDQFTLYPNPASEGGPVTLTLPQSLDRPVTAVTLADMTTGRRIVVTRFSADHGSVRFDATAPRGHYLVTLTDADNAPIVTKRLFIF